jgi:hypothetical protein
VKEINTQELLKKRLVRAESMVFRKIAGEAILVPLSTRVEDADSIYTLNEVAARIWELLDGSRDVEQIAETIFDEFEVSRQAAQDDAAELMEKLIAINAVREI